MSSPQFDVPGSWFDVCTSDMCSAQIHYAVIHTLTENTCSYNSINLHHTIIFALINVLLSIISCCLRNLSLINFLETSGMPFFICRSMGRHGVFLQSCSLVFFLRILQHLQADTLLTIHEQSHIHHCTVSLDAAGQKYACRCICPSPRSGPRCVDSAPRLWPRRDRMVPKRSSDRVQRMRQSWRKFSGVV